jgi:hypothetical protein
MEKHMGYITRQADLIMDISTCDKLSLEQKREAFELVVLLNHYQASIETLEELSGDNLMSIVENDELHEWEDELYRTAARINRVLKGTKIKWDRSAVGSKGWLRSNADTISNEITQELARAL